MIDCLGQHTVIPLLCMRQPFTLTSQTSCSFMLGLGVALAHRVGGQGERPALHATLALIPLLLPLQLGTYIGGSRVTIADKGLRSQVRLNTKVFRLSGSTSCC